MINGDGHRSDEEQVVAPAPLQEGGSEIDGSDQDWSMEHYEDSPKMENQETPVADPVDFVEITGDIHRCIQFVDVMVALYLPIRPHGMRCGSDEESEWFRWVEEVISSAARSCLMTLFYERSYCDWVVLENGSLWMHDVVATPDYGSIWLNAATENELKKDVGMRPVRYRELLQNGQDYLHLKQIWFPTLLYLGSTSMARLHRNPDHDGNPIRAYHGGLKYWLLKKHMDVDDSDG